MVPKDTSRAPRLRWQKSGREMSNSTGDGVLTRCRLPRSSPRSRISCATTPSSPFSHFPPPKDPASDPFHTENGGKATRYVVPIRRWRSTQRRIPKPPVRNLKAHHGDLLIIQDTPHTENKRAFGGCASRGCDSTSHYD